MRYMLLIYEDETLWERFTEQEKGAIYREVREFIEGLRKSGVYRAAENLDEAISIAARHPGVRVGRHAVEVRPIREWPPR